MLSGSIYFNMATVQYCCCGFVVAAAAVAVVVITIVIVLLLSLSFAFSLSLLPTFPSLIFYCKYD